MSYVDQGVQSARVPGNTVGLPGTLDTAVQGTAADELDFRGRGRANAVGRHHCCLKRQDAAGNDRSEDQRAAIAI